MDLSDYYLSRGMTFFCDPESRHERHLPRVYGVVPRNFGVDPHAAISVRLVLAEELPCPSFRRTSDGSTQAPTSERR